MQAVCCVGQEALGPGGDLDASALQAAEACWVGRGEGTGKDVLSCLLVRLTACFVNGCCPSGFGFGLSVCSAF